MIGGHFYRPDSVLAWQPAICRHAVGHWRDQDQNSRPRAHERPITLTTDEFPFPSLKQPRPCMTCSSGRSFHFFPLNSPDSERVQCRLGQSRDPENPAAKIPSKNHFLTRSGMVLLGYIATVYQVCRISSRKILRYYVSRTLRTACPPKSANIKTRGESIFLLYTRASFFAPYSLHFSSFISEVSFNEVRTYRTTEI